MCVRDREGDNNKVLLKFLLPFPDPKALQTTWFDHLRLPTKANLFFFK